MSTSREIKRFDLEPLVRDVTRRTTRVVVIAMSVKARRELVAVL